MTPAQKFLQLVKLFSLDSKRYGPKDCKSPCCQEWNDHQDPLLRPPAEVGKQKIFGGKIAYIVYHSKGNCELIIFYNRT